MCRSVIAVGVVVGILAVGGCGGSPGKLAPLRDTPTTRARTGQAQPAPSGAGLRAALKHLIDVGAPAGYEMVPPDLDVDPASLEASLARRFQGARFQRGMRRVWGNRQGQVVVLALYAFPDASAAQQSLACECDAGPAPGLAGSILQTWTGGEAVNVVAGSYLVVVSGAGRVGPPPVAVLVAVARSVRGGATGTRAPTGAGGVSL